MEGYPNTYQADAQKEQRIERPQVFEPALKHFPRAFRLGDPLFQDPEIKRQWLNARLKVIEHLLQMISSSRWNEHLVLRGSLLLKAWLGEVAREPGDVDWVFRPDNATLKHPLSGQLFDELIQMVSEHPQIGDVTIEIDQISIDDIWTYERAEGRRIVFLWKAENLPGGELQMDVVFGEKLLAEPIGMSMLLSEGNPIHIWSASKELSLAWKLLWLETDSYPQGKDLYDATLLAEQTQLPFDLLHQVLLSSQDWRLFAKNKDISWRSGFPWMMDTEQVDWDNFKLEYPWVEGEASDWLARLTQALAPTFASLDNRLYPNQ